MEDILKKYEKISIKESFSKLKSSKEGLSEQESKKRLEKYGFNELKEKRRITALKVFFRQFTNFIVWVLLAAAAISYFIHEFISFWVVLFIISFVILLGFIQEYRAEKAMEALKKIVQPISKVIRQGKVKEMQTMEIVPGDILLLEMGDKIPADARIFDIIGLKVDESMLTGESLPVEKSESDFIFSGTQIVHGKCKALVIATGMQTKIGYISKMIQQNEETTPLQIKITLLARKLAFLAIIACVFTFIIGFFKGAPLGEMLLISLALAVAAVPEGLPLTLTLTLAHGMHQMAKQNAIMRKLLGVETLGSTTVICTDKTGTLTKNEMTVNKIYFNGKIADITGTGYEPKGNFLFDGKKINTSKEKTLIKFLKSAALCNNSSLERTAEGWKSIGDPTESALIVAAAKAEIWKDDLDMEYKRDEEIIFTSERKLMTTLHEHKKEKIAFVKGASEIILEKCSYIEENGKIKKIDRKTKEKILRVNGDFANSALRVLGIAYRKMPASAKELKHEDIEKDLVFLGLAGMMDPPRDEVKEAISMCRNAGIKVIMITGDNENTAKAIAKQIGLFEKTNSDNIKSQKLKNMLDDHVITGKELDKITEKELSRIIDYVCVYARTMPEHKLKIISSLKKKGHIVAMTGDGVNDAPALKKADIGIAMGIKGTDVAKESSEMVLQDDNFATIVNAVKRGRAIYENIEKFICYLVSRNFTEVFLIILGIIFLGFELLPLLALQILFINTFDEIMPSLGLGLDPIREGIMLNKPKGTKERFLKKRNLIIVASTAVFVASTSFLVFVLNNPMGDVVKARTLTFATIVSTILFIPFAFRSLHDSVFKIGVFSNRLLAMGAGSTFLLTLVIMNISFFQDIFEFAPLSPIEWVMPLGVAFSSMLFIEMMKWATKNLV